MSTIAEEFRTPLVKWLYTIYLFDTSRHGIPAKDLERQLGEIYRCAWCMGHKIREFLSDMDVGMLFGEFEIDEAMIGSHRPGKRGRGAAGKPVVLGMRQRQGWTRVLVIPDAKATTIQPLIDQSVAAGATVYTDEWWGYRLVMQAGYDHHRVHHRSKSYPYGDSHVNAVEYCWACLNLSIRRIHVQVSKKWMHN